MLLLGVLQLVRQAKIEEQIKAALSPLHSTPVSVSISDAPSNDYTTIMRRLNVLHDKEAYLHVKKEKEKPLPSIGSFNWIGREDSPAMVKLSRAWLSAHICSEGVAVLPVTALKVSLHVS